MRSFNAGSTKRTLSASRSTFDEVRAMVDVGVVLKRFETPDETRDLELGKFEIVRIGGVIIGRATYQPG